MSLRSRGVDEWRSNGDVVGPFFAMTSSAQTHADMPAPADRTGRRQHGPAGDGWRRCVVRGGWAALATALVGAATAQAAESTRPDVEGALGLVATHTPIYLGDSHTENKLSPAFFFRYRRLTITNSGGFVTRKRDEVDRGLGLDLSKSDRVRIKLGLRYDPGRSEGDSPALQGLGDVKSTLRLRLSGVWRLDHGLSVGAAWTVDAFGRGGGNQGEATLQHEQALAGDSVLAFGLSLSLAGDRYLQTYYGVNEEQAARTGYPVYTPPFGLRDLALTASLRGPLSPHWMYLAHAQATRLLGSAADSPLALDRTGLRFSAGLAYRF